MLEFSAAPTRREIPALDLYERSLATRQLWARDGDGVRFQLPVSDWTRSAIPGDASLLARCSGLTLDVGCGPGRLAARLAQTGVPALGIDISPRAVALARKRGAKAMRRCVFGPIPQAGQWNSALLADGNIGIGGNPTLLLGRVRELLAPSGHILVELGSPAVASGIRHLRLEDECGAGSKPFPWAQVGVRDISVLASHSNLTLVERWVSAGRWFAQLRRS